MSDKQNTLKAVRIARCLTQQQLAELLYVSKPTYANWEKDLGKMPLEKIILLINVLKLEKQYLFEFFKMEDNDEDKSTNRNILEEVYKEVCDIKEKIYSKRNLFTWLLLFPFILHAQTGSLEATVADGTSGSVIREASAIIISKKDSILQKFARSDKNGKFHIQGIPANTYLLMVTYPGYADYVYNFTVDNNGFLLKLGKLSLFKKAILLKEVVVKGNASKIRIKGDTTEFDAKAFYTEPNAKVEDMLIQFPGLRVDQNGKITAYGQKVDKVLVDGEEFFGNDPTLVTRNIRADMVDKVQLYDKKSDQALFSGIDDDKSKRTLDVKLKEDKKNGYFGKIDIGKSNEKYYQAQGMFNYFTNNRKLAAYFVSGNNGKVGLNIPDRASYGAGALQFGAGGLLFSGRDEDITNSLGDFTGQGIPDAQSGGLHYDTKWKEGKESLNLNYQVTRMGIEGTRYSLSQSNLTDGGINSSSDEFFNPSLFTQGLNAIFDSRPNATTTLKLTLDGLIKKGKSHSLYEQESSLTDQTLLNQSRRNLDKDADKQSFKSSLLIAKRLHKTGRTLSLFLEGGFTGDKSNRLLDADNYFYTRFGEIDTIEQIKQFQKYHIYGSSLRSSLTYTEPLVPSLSLRLTSGFTLNNGAYKRDSYKLDEQQSPIETESIYTNDLDTKETIGKGGLIFSYKKNKSTVNLGTDLNIVNFVQNNLLNTLSYKRAFFLWHPQVNFKYNLGAQAILKTGYKGGTQQPNLDQLLPINSNDDPLNIIVGNPQLNSSFKNEFYADYSSFNILKNRGITIKSTYDWTLNAISNKIETDEFGKSVFSFFNLPNHNFRSFSLYTGLQQMIGTKGLNIGLSLSGNGNQYYTQINDNVNRIRMETLGTSISLNKFGQSKLNFGIILSPKYNFISSSLQSNINSNGWTLDSEATLSLKLPFNCNIKSELNYEYAEKTVLFNQDFNRIIMNAEFNKMLLKNRNLKFLVKVNDLFDQNVGFNRSVINNTIVQNNFSTIRRYLLFSLIWDFNKMGGATKQNIEML